MKIILLGSKRKLLYFLLILIIVILSFICIRMYRTNNSNIVMGGTLSKEELLEPKELEVNKNITVYRDLEKYFRPSKLPILNDIIFEHYQDETIPTDLIKTPEDTIINYFSVLREAENLTKDKSGGCGTVGNAKLPYPFAYELLSDSYKEKISYDEYLKSFEGIGHINLLKLNKIPTDDNHKNNLKYFVEIETIEGSSKDVTYFAYYYGYIYLIKDKGVYKISDMNFIGEDFLCAPYHLWQHNAEAVVDITYGNWCKLAKERYPMEQEGYEKKIYFKGTDGNDYMILFFELTNDTDIQIAQYIKDSNGKWINIKLDVNECLERNKRNN